MAAAVKRQALQRGRGIAWSAAVGAMEGQARGANSRGRGHSPLGNATSGCRRRTMSPAQAERELVESRGWAVFWTGYLACPQSVCIRRRAVRKCLRGRAEWTDQIRPCRGGAANWNTRKRPEERTVLDSAWAAGEDAQPNATRATRQIIPGETQLRHQRPKAFAPPATHGAMQPPTIPAFAWVQ